MRFATGLFTPDMNDGKHVFVFGSNIAGRHGKGAALEAFNHWGAVAGIGRGSANCSYAIPTKTVSLETLPSDEIWENVCDFIRFAKRNHELTFLVTAIGTGLAGCTHEQIAPMFKDTRDNCVLPKEWESILCAAGKGEK